MEQETIKMEETRKQPSKSEVIGSFIGMGMVGFCSIINMYSMGACSALGITNQEALSEDLENDPFLNSALQRFTCELYYRFGLFLAPLSIGIITSRHYLSEHNKNGECGTGDNKNGGDEKTAE